VKFLVGVKLGFGKNTFEQAGLIPAVEWVADVIVISDSEGKVQ
jgi:hypothetical protein